MDEYYQPDCVGLPKQGDNVHERNNRWALYFALSRGIDNARIIAVWDGKNESAKDLDARLVKHMVDLMRYMGGMVEQIHAGISLLPVLTELLADANPISVAPVKSMAPANGKATKMPSRRKK